MTINNRVCLVSALDGFRASPASYYGTDVPGGAAGGPAGSSSMTFFCVVYPYQINAATRMLFGRSTLVAAGWTLWSTAGNIRALVYNGTPAAVEVAVAGGYEAYEGLRVPYLALASYQNGTLTFYLNGVLVGTTILGAGFTPLADPTTYGVRSSTAAGYATSEMLSDCGMLDAYDPTTFVSTLYGNGGPGLSAMWLDDMRNGRYFTWPRAAAVNSDWYWAAADANIGMGTKATWLDRYTATPMLKFGQVQGASFPARPL